MRFVPIKNVEQQSVLSLHRVRQGFVKARTAQANQIRGLLSEFGLVIPQGINHIARRVPELIEDAENDLTGSFRSLIGRLMDHLKELDRQVRDLEAQIQSWHRQSDDSCKLAQVPGIGPITATALVASVGDAKSFTNGRQLAAWGSDWCLNKNQAEEKIRCLVSVREATLTYGRCLSMGHVLLFAQLKERTTKMDGFLDCYSGAITT